MSALERAREALPDEARDVRLNLESVLGASSLTIDQRWMVALAAAFSSGNPGFAAAVQEATLAHASREVAEDARAAAILMAMNNIYYRFRHQVANPAYEAMPARLRMNRLARPATSKADFELACLAVSALNGCEACVRAHEAAVLKAGLTTEIVHDAVRVAATIRAAALGLGIAELPLPAPAPAPAVAGPAPAG